MTKQIATCAKLLAQYPDQLHAVLIKPRDRRARHIDIDDVVRNVASLSQFSIVGFTEKELGDSCLSRMEAIARIRLALDDAGLRAKPIHIFGSLDPVSVCLYFVSGAEIFDGLTWLRYGYYEGSAMYIQNCAARLHELQHTDDQIK
ncbi:MAG: hypothetical protein IT357_05835, partial [Gemmatimonadaceae bacterium]|nr:hypothetical protein [Gemmatimonadaceae bacterium]